MSMNTTLQRFGHPASVIFESRHWVVLIRPRQTTAYSAVIAARSTAERLADLQPEEAAELPAVMGRYEAAVRRLAPAVKFNYLALMMVDPHPHFHAIPRYQSVIRIDGTAYPDRDFPRPPDVLQGLDVDAATLESWRAALAGAAARISRA
jgi:diadenosine tetraphosphate (Ap4A) HIT family hydrolase